VEFERIPLPRQRIPLAPSHLKNALSGRLDTNEDTERWQGFYGYLVTLGAIHAANTPNGARVTEGASCFAVTAGQRGGRAGDDHARRRADGTCSRGHFEFRLTAVMTMSTAQSRRKGVVECALDMLTPHAGTPNMGTALFNRHRIKPQILCTGRTAGEYVA
jgi:hypothetical protein